MASDPSKFGKPDVWAAGRYARTNRRSSRMAVCPLLRACGTTGACGSGTRRTGHRSGASRRFGKWACSHEVIGMPIGSDTITRCRLLRPTVGPTCRTVACGRYLKDRALPPIGRSDRSRPSSDVPNQEFERDLVALSKRAGWPADRAKRFTNQGDGRWSAIASAVGAAAPGKYYLEESHVEGQIGWWTSNRSSYDFGDAYVERQIVSRFSEDPSSDDRRGAFGGTQSTVSKDISGR